MIITQTGIVDIIPEYNRALRPIFCVSKGDADSRMINITVQNAGNNFNIPEGANVYVAGKKLDNTIFTYECSYSGYIVTFPITEQMSAVSGLVLCEIQIVVAGDPLGSANFCFWVEPSPIENGTTSESDLNIFVQAISDLGGYEFLTDEVAVLSARMDQFARLPDGSLSTAADAELADIRVKADGATAATAGDAVREQFTELKNDLNVVSEGYSPLQYTTNENVYVGDNGVYVSNNNHRSTSHISVTPGELLYIYNPHVTYNNAWYDENDAYISKFRIDAGTPATLTVPANAKYMALSNTKQYFFTGLFRDGIGIENKESITAIEQSVGSVTDCIKTVNSGLVAFDIGWKANTRILRDNGSEVTDTGFYATDYIYIPKDALFLLETSTTLSWGALYDENKTYIMPEGYGVGESRLIFTDAGRYVRFSAPLDVMQGVLLKIYKPTDTTLTYAGMPADAKVVGDKISAIVQNNAVIPPYYESHLSSKESIIRGHFDNCAFDGDGLIFLTDTHFSSDLFTSATPTSFFNANNSFSLIADIIGKCAIDKIVFGGDLVNSTPDVDTMLLCMSSFGTRFGARQDRLRYCVGNHEYFTGNDLGQTIKPTPAMLYGASVKYNEDVVLGKGDMVTYYFDNALQKIRYFVVSCGRDTETTTTQIAWLLNAFKEIPANYKVVVIGHGFIADNMTAFRGGYAPIAAALDAVKAKTDYVYNNVTYDYSTLSNVDVVCMITGHTHIDGSIITTGGIPCICTTTDSYDLNIELVNGTPTNVPRQKGTINEQAFDVFQFDFTNRKIYATRIGYGADREFSY